MKKIFLIAISISAIATAAKAFKSLDGKANVAGFSEIISKTVASAKYCPKVKAGDVCLMNWEQAILFCKSRKSHLPTAREYAELIEPRGTQVLETSDVVGAAPAGFYLVDSKNPDGSLDKFYMNHSRYKRPASETKSHLLWTASIPPEYPQYAHVYYDEWGGGGGNRQDHLLNQRNAVQCVLDR